MDSLVENKLDNDMFEYCLNMFKLDMLKAFCW